MPAHEYDIFLSHAWADGDRPRQIADELRKAGLRVWFDASEINDFESISYAVNSGLAKAKALLAYFSKTYPTRRACQWELTAAFMAGQAEGDPRRRVLVINPETTSAHIHPVQLRDAKFRRAPKNGAELTEMVQSVVTHLSGLAGAFTNIQPLSVPQWHPLSPAGSTRFVGRIEKMWELHSVLWAGDAVQITAAAAATGGVAQLHGLAGVGKSLLAEEYALRFGPAYPGGIFWLRAYGNDDTSSAVEERREVMRATQIRGIAERLGLTIDSLNAGQIDGVLGRELARIGKPCLWIVDDVPNGLQAGALRRWFAPNPVARTLITTRSRAYDALARPVDVSVLQSDEAFQLLTSRRQPTNNEEEKEARALVRDLGCHALALDVAAAALQSYGDEPYKTFRNELAGQDNDTLELAASLSDALPNGHVPSIAGTVRQSIRGLGSEGQDLLRLASVLALAPIPASLVIGVFESVGVRNADWAQRKAFQQLTHASLAEIAGDGARTVHTLVSRTMRFQEKATPGRTNVLRVAAVHVLTGIIASIPHIGQYDRIATEMPHARSLAAESSESAELSALAACIAKRDFEQGNFDSARELQKQVLHAQERVLGDEHRDTLTARHNLASTLHAQGDYAAARKLQEKVLHARERLLGDEHLDTLSAKHNLASTLHVQGDYFVSRTLRGQVLETRRRALGDEHPDTLTAMNNLALTLRAQGDYAAARKLQERVVGSCERVLGDEHPDTLTAMNTLAHTFWAQGDHAAARKLEEQVLDARRHVLGDEHPHTLTTMNNLALTLRAQGDTTSARKLQDQVLEARQRMLGDEHPSTLTAMNTLASTLRAQGDYGAARKLQEQVLQARRRVLGEEHPATLTTMNNLALTLRAQGDYAAACKLQEQVLEALRPVLGDEHPGTLTAMTNLTSMLAAQALCASGRELDEQVLEGPPVPAGLGFDFAKPPLAE